MRLQTGRSTYPVPEGDSSSYARLSHPTFGPTPLLHGGSEAHQRFYKAVSNLARRSYSLLSKITLLAYSTNCITRYLRATRCAFLSGWRDTL